jgi:hypothetical protein
MKQKQVEELIISFSLNFQCSCDIAVNKCVACREMEMLIRMLQDTIKYKELIEEDAQEA